MTTPPPGPILTKLHRNNLSLPFTKIAKNDPLKRMAARGHDLYHGMTNLQDIIIKIQNSLAEMVVG